MKNGSLTIIKKNRETPLSLHVSRLKCPASLGRLVLARFRAAHYQFTAQKFLVVQLGHRALGFVDRLHLDKGKAFRTLVMPIADDFRVLDMANAVEQLEEIALARVEGQISDVQTRRSYFDWFRFARRSRLLLRTVAGWSRR